MILDAGFLISVDRSDTSARNLLVAMVRREVPLHTTHPVVAQVWRRGATQARLATFLRSVTMHPLDDAKALGQLLALGETSDVVDAHLVLVAVRLGEPILTGDVDDLTRLASPFGRVAPAIHAWP